MKQIIHILKTERQFWKLFGAFLIPIGLFCLLVFIIPGIAAACGENAVFDNGQPVTGWRATLFCIVGWPLFTLIFSGLCAWLLFMRRTVWPSMGKSSSSRK